MLVLCGAEYRYPLGVASGNTNLSDRHANKLALIGDQQQFVGIFDREGGDQPAAAAARA